MFCAHFDTSATEADKIPGQQSRAVRERDPLYPEPARYSVSSDGGPISEYGTVCITYGAGGITPSGVYSMYDGAKGECLSIVNLSNIAKAYALAAYELCG